MTFEVEDATLCDKYTIDIVPDQHGLVITINGKDLVLDVNMNTLTIYECDEDGDIKNGAKHLSIDIPFQSSLNT